MKTKIIHIALGIVLAGSLLSCSSTTQFSPGKGSKFQYTYRLVSPEENRDLIYQDDSIIIQFRFDEAAIRFQVQNISEARLMIRWEKASLGLNGRYFPVRHCTNLYGDSSDSKSVMLPPLGYLRDIAIPRDNISYDGSRWVETELFPTTDRNSPVLREAIKKNAGRRVTLMLPLAFESTEKNYEFDFRVDSVKQILWKDYVPFKRTPEPPDAGRKTQTWDNVTTAVIAVGVLGFSAYVLTLKKNPPSE